MTQKYFGGIIPTPAEETELDKDLKATVKDAIKEAKACMDSYHIADALEAIFSMLRRANKYIDETTPWVLAKDEANKARLGTVIYNLLETIRVGAVLLTPFIPTTAEKIFSQLGTDEISYESISEFGALKSGASLGEASVLFARVDEAAFYKKLEEKKKAEEAEEKTVEEPEHEETITIDGFKAVELRTAQIIACEKVPKAKKLLKLQVDLGYEKRQIVSGIAKFYEPDALIGKKIVLVCNLKPATLCGIESNGMILASGEEQVRVIFLDPETPLGERIR
jgi:methionyl-tRNA synthetase